MNRTAKIILLVLAVLVAVGGVMIFYKTIVSPPGKLDFDNQFAESAKKDVDSSKNSKSDYSLDSAYTAVTHEIQFQELNNLLPKEDGDKLLKSFVENYVPLYVNNCNNKFQQHVWPEAVLNKMHQHIAELHALKTSDGKKIVDGADKDSIDKVDQIISNYYAAKKAASVGGYSSLADSQAKIKNAKSFLDKYPVLNECESLKNSINKDLPERLSKAHYSYLAGQVEQLKNYIYSDTWASHANSVLDKIKEYSSRGESVYGKENVKDVSALNSKVDYYDNMAMDAGN